MLSYSRFVAARKVFTQTLADVLASYVTILLSGDGVNAANNNTYLDTSTNALAITPTGTPSQGSFGPFGSDWATSFTWSPVGAVSFTNAGNAMGTGDFTAECWAYFTAWGTYAGGVFSCPGGGNSGVSNSVANLWAVAVHSNGWYFSANGSQVAYTTVLPKRNTWYHIAYVKTGGSTKIYLNGVNIYTVADTMNYTNTKISIGDYWTGPECGINGVVSNFRLVKGSAVYTSNFTVPTTRLPAITGTQLLTCQDNRFLDNSTIAQTPVVYGSAAISTFSPFKTVTYDPAINGASVLLNGTTDYLTAASSTNNVILSQDFTWEAFIYPKAGGAIQPIIANDQILLFMQNTNNLYFTIQSVANMDSLVAVGLNQWHHVAITRTGSVYALWMDGVQLKTFTRAGDVYYQYATRIGWDPTLHFFNGYISNARVVIGTAVYSGTTYTVPTSSLMAITNTKLLVTNSNAGIIDESKLQNWTSVGNAQITTSSKKFGTGSIKLDAGGYLQTPITNPPQISMNTSANWTVEMWLCRTGTYGYASFPCGIGQYSPSGAFMDWGFGIDWQSYAHFYYWTGSAAVNLTGSTVLALNQWYHLAVTCEAGVISLFVNGVKEGLVNTFTAISVTQSYITIGQMNTYTAPILVDDVRITNGACRYSRNFTPAKNPNLSLDSQSNYTQLQLSYEPPVAGMGVITLTAYGSAQISTAQKKFGTSSLYFPGGSGDYAMGPASTLLYNFGTGNYTVELWIYRQTNAGSCIMDFANSGVNGPRLWVNASNKLSYGVSGITNIVGATTIQNNTWYHVAVARASGITKMFLDGVQEGSSWTDSTDCNNNQFRLGMWITGGNPFVGYLDSIRLTKGVARYTANFTSPVTELPDVTDNYWSVTSLLLKAEGTNGSTSISGLSGMTSDGTNGIFLDSSLNNFTVTPTGAPSQGSFTPYAPNWSVYSDGTTGNGQKVSWSSNFALGTGDFTMECWLRVKDLSTARDILDIYDGNSAGRMLLLLSTSGVIQLAGASGAVKTSGGVVLTNVWNHISVCRASGSTRIYLNGTQVNTTYSDSTNYTCTTGFVFIGMNGADTSQAMSGNLSNLRLVKGTALYTSDFSVPTAALTAVTNTQLLTCQSNRFLDNSSNNSTLTVTGTLQVVPMSPFTKLDTISVNTDWSTYFGNSVYQVSTCSLSVPTNAGITLGTGDFTIEAFGKVEYAPYNNGVYPLSLIFGNSSSAWSLNLGNPGRYSQISFMSSASGQSWSSQTLNSGIIPVTGRWYHVALTRQGNLLTLWVDGVSKASMTYTWALEGTTPTIQIGHFLGGYVSNARIIKGTAIYTSNFAVPTQTLTAVSGTQLLMCTSNKFTDASTNNLTVTANTNPLISTQSPFPLAVVSNSICGSLYFNGTSDIITSAISPNVVMGTSDFTAECWAYQSARTAIGFLLGVTTNSGSTGWALYIQQATGCVTVSTVGSTIMTTTASVSLNTWTHIALVRTGNVFKIYINGIDGGGSVTNAVNFTDNTGVFIAGANGYFYNGYISNVRIVKGTALYNINFTPELGPLTAITNTQLLLSGINGQVVDQSMTSTLMLKGTAAISTSNFKYGTSSLRIPGGSGNYVEIINPPTLGAQDFTLEFWFNFVTVVDNKHLVILNANATGYAGFGVRTSSTTGLLFYASINGTTWQFTTAVTTPMVAGTWYHLRVSRVGSNYYVLKDGVQIYESTLTGTLYAGTINRIGEYTTLGSSPDCYIDDFRLTVGKARNYYDVPTVAF
jgi:hypothetical protein